MIKQLGQHGVSCAAKSAFNLRGTPRWLIKVFASQASGVASIHLVGGEEDGDDGWMMALIHAPVINARLLGTDYSLEEAA